MLSLCGCRLSELVDEISNLKLLRYLDLSFTGISRLPDTICMLCNLQTLLLLGCHKLTELPSKFSKLINLRHLELPSSIKKMPKNIGSLSNLQKLDYFIVEEQSGSDLKDLEKLNHLCGKIHIKGLGKVIDPTNVRTRSLKEKKYLEEIKITFDGGREDMDGTIVESNKSVLEALEPNSNLKMLTITQYRGNSFPNWLSGSHLSPLEQLSSLKELSISNCDGIKIFRNDSTNVPFKFLEVLRFENMKNWEEWLCMEGFPRLKELSIVNCPKLKRALPQHLPSIQKLVINGCEMLDVSVPNGNNIIDLYIWDCGRILINELSPSLKSFVLWKYQYVEFSIYHLINCPFLEVLKLDFKEGVECPSLDLCCYNSLWELSIRGWRSSSLLSSLHLFTHLSDLFVSACPELESFPTEGFPSNLKYLYIIDCPSLEHLPEECGLLDVLEIRDCPLLEEKYKKEGGERWHTISHIRVVYIDGTEQHSNER